MIEIRKPDAMLKKLLPPIELRQGIHYKPSQFALPFEHRGKPYVFHTLTKQCIEGRLPKSTGVGEGFDELIIAQFLVPEGKDECAYYNQISAITRAYTRKKRIGAYTILPTLGCNARCVYCYEEGMKPVTMTPETVQQTIRFILNTRQREGVHLRWFGGEPLLGEKTIDCVCEAMREAEIPYRSSMVSNASLITPDIISKMTTVWKLNRIQVSMDGAEEDYIPRKNYPTYRGYYCSVLENVSAMSKAGIAVTIRCNVDEENWARIPQFMDDLKENISHKEKVSVYFSPLYSVRISDRDAAVCETVRRARSMIEEAGFHAAPFMEPYFNFRVTHCMADEGSVVIAPDGKLYPCEHCPPESCFGDIWNGVTDEVARKEFCRVDKTQEKCRTCPFLPDCTSFVSCPVQDKHCREVHEMMTIDTLRRMVDRKEDEGADTLVC